MADSDPARFRVIQKREVRPSRCLDDRHNRVDLSFSRPRQCSFEFVCVASQTIFVPELWCKSALDHDRGTSVARSRTQLADSTHRNPRVCMSLMSARVGSLIVLLSGLLTGAPLHAQLGTLKPPPPPPPTADAAVTSKFDPLLLLRSSLTTGQSLVVVTAVDADSLASVSLLVQ